MSEDPPEDKAKADLCERCGGLIADAIFTERHPIFGPLTCRQTKCVRCAFVEGFRARSLKARPYRIPAQRPTPEGEPPAAYVTSFNAEKASRIKSGEGVES